MAERYKIVLSGMVFFLLLGVCSGAWSAEEDKIAALQKQISALEKQKAQLESEGEKLMAKGDKLSFKIDALKMRSKGGLGIIGRYKLSRNLRKAQALSEKVQSLGKRLHRIEGELKGRKGELKGEYDRQIAILLGKLNGSGQTEETGKILSKLKEYRVAKEQLKEQLKEQEKKKLEPLDIAEIKIQEYDGPQEIREKADLINDFATKLQSRMDMLNARARKLEVELKTRERLGEFAEEISFFGERISRDEVVSDAAKDVTERPDDNVVDVPDKREPDTLTGIEADVPIRGVDAAKPTETEPPPKMTEVEVEPSEPPGKIVVERNGVSASFVVTSLEQIRREIGLLGKQEQDMKKELAALMEKATSFYKKADEVEKSETKKSGQKGEKR